MVERIGPYEVLRRIGGGGMGEVFLALDPDGRTVAVKTIHAHLLDLPNARARMGREVETMRRIRHDHVVQVVGSDVEGDRPYLVTRYAQGLALDRVVSERGPFAGDALTRFVRAGTEAVAAVHAVQVVHRDLKPANVIVSDGLPTLIDFGIAHAVDATRLTQHGSRAGTTWYMAPELWKGAEAGSAADVFAWAATLVFAATGRHVFRAPTDVGVWEAVRSGRPDLAGIPDGWREPISLALAPDPRDRPDAAELAVRLAPHRRTPPPPPPGPPPAGEPYARPAPEPPPPGAEPRKGPERRVVAEVGLGDVISGAERSVRLDGREVSFAVPVGATDGTEVRIRGEGDPGYDGGPAGDVVVGLTVRPDAEFAREGDDLRGPVEVHATRAEEGGVQRVRTPGGEITVRIPAGLVDGQALKIRGHGVPKADGSGRGDLFLIAAVRASAAQRKALDDLNQHARAARRALDQAEQERKKGSTWRNAKGEIVSLDFAALVGQAGDRLKKAEVAFALSGPAVTAVARADLAEVRDSTERIMAISGGGERGADVPFRVTLDLAEVLGETGHECRIDDEDVAFTLPAGVRSGQVVTHRGLGGAGRYGGEPGDLIVTVTVRPHPDFRRDEDDLHHIADVPSDLAESGGEWSFQGLDGRRITLRIPPRTPEGRRFRISGRGLPGEDGRGDLIVQIRHAP